MGSDELFKKRKAWALSDLERSKGKISRRPRFLIVSEGKKTEPYYFEDLCEFYKLRPHRVRVVPGNKGSSPISVVNYAKELFDEDAHIGGDCYDKVFCVIDRDKHDSYELALHTIEDLRHENFPFVPINSVPCFEYWLLLHFGYTRPSFHSNDKKSICDCVIKELRKNPGFENYTKGKRGIYEILRDKISIAIKNAKQVEKEAYETKAASKKTKQDNPLTLVYQLVEALQKLADE